MKLRRFINTYLLGDLFVELKRIQITQEIIVGQLEDAQAALTKIDAATTAAGELQAEIATNMNEISDDIDTLLAQVAAGQPIPASFVADMQAKADRLAELSAKQGELAAFSKAVASKSPTNPVPVPVPDDLPQA